MTTTNAKRKPIVKAVVEDTNQAPAKTPRRKPAAKKAVEAPKPVEPKVEENPSEDLEAITLLDKKENNFVDEDELLATALNEYNEEGKLLGDKDYTISTDSFNYRMLNGNSDNQYPLGVWVRDPDTLTGLQARAFERMANDNARPQDIILVDFAEQNNVNTDNNMLSFFARKGAEWNNFLPVGTRKLRNSKVTYNPGSLSGNTERVVAALMRKMDLGVPIIVRLWHSGIVFSINPSDKAERLALVDKLNSAHLQTLQRTNGLVHGTSSYYANRIIINEFMRHVTSSNIDRSLWPQITNIMDHRDIQFMAWALMAAAYPRGYRLHEQCGGLKDVVDADGKPLTNDEGKPKKNICGHINESIIDFNLICQIDNSAFTQWQKDFISRRIDENSPATLEDIKKYQSEGEMHREDRIEIDEELSVVVKAPVASLHISIGEEWIDSVERAVEQIINIDTDDETKNGYINRQLEATAAMDIAHWVTAFDFAGEIIDDRGGIERIFRSLGNNEKQRDTLFDSIRNRMSKRLAAVIAIPTFECSSCHNMSNKIQHNGTAFYTPIDMVSRFFTLTARNQ